MSGRKIEKSTTFCFTSSREKKIKGRKKEGMNTKIRQPVIEERIEKAEKRKNRKRQQRKADKGRLKNVGK